jgi:hypothetical protein
MTFLACIAEPAAGSELGWGEVTEDDDAAGGGADVLPASFCCRQWP